MAKQFRLGKLDGRVLFSPGHTLCSITYVFGDAAFVHDTLFMPDTGTARADFPGGSARRLWHSIEAILALPDETRLFTGHDYRQGGREARWESSVAEQKRTNAHLAGRDEAGVRRIARGARPDAADAEAHPARAAGQSARRPPARPREPMAAAT